MKKIIGLILVLSLGLVSCSKDDNKSSDVDPVFSLEYHPLKSLSEVKGKSFRYAGIKIGDKKVGLFSDTSPECSTSDLIVFYPENGEKNSPITFFRKTKICSGFDEINFIDYYMNKEGLLSTRLMKNYEPSTDISSNSIIETSFTEGRRYELQIGFQGKYLRIEDRMSHYVRLNPDEVVYLYFKE